MPSKGAEEIDFSLLNTKKLAKIEKISLASTIFSKIITDNVKILRQNCRKHPDSYVIFAIF